jgi:hypothetical protein
MPFAGGESERVGVADPQKPGKIQRCRAPHALFSRAECRFDSVRSERITLPAYREPVTPRHSVARHTSRWHLLQ